MNIRYYNRGTAIWIDFRIGGERYREATGCTVQLEAEKQVPRIISECVAKAAKAQVAPILPETVKVAQVGGLTLREAFKKGMLEREKWIESKDKDSINLSAESVMKYWGEETTVNTFTRELVLQWRSEMLKAPGKRAGSTLTHSTINHRLSMLTTLLEVAGAAPHTVKHLSTKGNGRERRITDVEVEALQQWLEENNWRTGAAAMGQLVTLGLETGARAGELRGLSWGDVGTDTLTFRDTKNFSSRTIPMTETAKYVLASRRASTVQVGPFSDLSKDRYVELWDLARKALGLGLDVDFVFHGLRHEALSRLSDSGANGPVIQAIAGHSSIVTTQRYIHSSLAAMATAMGIK